VITYPGQINQYIVDTGSNGLCTKVHNLQKAKFGMPSADDPSSGLHESAAHEMG